MKNKKIRNFSLIFLTVSLVVLSLVLSNPTKIMSFTTPNTSEVHDYIWIEGNDELDAFCAGNGTDGLSWETAHVIENYEITRVGEIPFYVGLTTRYLIIQSCTFDGIASMIDECQNVNITDCTITGGDVDILVIAQCRNVWVKNNEISGEGYGINMWTNNSDVFVSENTIDADTGIYIRDTDYCNFTYNQGTVTGLYGIVLIDTTIGQTNPPTYNTVAYNCFKGDSLKEIVSDGGENNYVYDNGCSLIPGYSLIILMAVALAVTSGITILIIKKRMK